MVEANTHEWDKKVTPRQGNDNDNGPHLLHIQITAMNEKLMNYKEQLKTAHVSLVDGIKKAAKDTLERKKLYEQHRQRLIEKANNIARLSETTTFAHREYVKLDDMMKVNDVLDVIVDELTEEDLDARIRLIESLIKPYDLTEAGELRLPDEKQNISSVSGSSSDKAQEDIGTQEGNTIAWLCSIHTLHPRVPIY